MSYKMIAFDMDGTLLNSHKQVTPVTLKAINTAVSEGKLVVLSTGRCLAELNEYLPVLRDVRYLCCVSGGYVFDTVTGTYICNESLPPETVRSILEITKLEDCMVQLMNDKSIVSRNDVENMQLYGMGLYRDMFRRVTYMVDDVREYYEKNVPAVNKICVYHRSPEARERALDRLKETGAQLMRSETTSAECSGRGVTKAAGLIRLCDKLGMSMSDVICVGDADNDIDALSCAGLGIAMGNANAGVKKICGAVVADNDNDGCAEAVYKYLLG